MGKLTAPLEILADFIACKDAEIVALRATRWNTQAASVVVGSPRKASGSCAATDEEASSSDESSYEDNAHDNEDLTCAERKDAETVALGATRWDTPTASVVVGSPRKASGSCAATDEDASSSDESSYEDNAHDNEDLPCAERRITESPPDVWNEQNEGVVE